MTLYDFNEKAPPALYNYEHDGNYIKGNPRIDFLHTKGIETDLNHPTKLKEEKRFEFENSLRKRHATELMFQNLRAKKELQGTTNMVRQPRPI